MQRNEVEAIFQERKEKLLQGITPSTNPIAIIMGGQPACGKSFLLEIAKSDNIDKKFFCVVMFGLINVNILYYSFSTLYQMCNLRQSL